MRKLLAAATVSIFALAVPVSTGALPFLFSANYLPHRYCYLSQPWLVWTNVFMDGLIATSYVLIFACLFGIVGKLRHLRELHDYLWIFLSFGTFILACAATHFMEVVTIWWAVYRLSAILKFACAVASVSTAILFFMAVPKIIRGLEQFLDTLRRSQLEHASDVTERAKIRDQSRETEAQLRAILDSVVDSIITIDSMGIIVSVNLAVTKMFAYQAEELVGRNVKMLMPEPNRGNHDGHLARYQSTGATKAIGVGRKLEGLRKDGRVFPMELTITEISGDGRRMFVGLIRDLTEHDRAEEELKKRASLLDLAPDAILMRDLKNRVVFWNRGAQRMYGWAADEAEGRVAHDLLQTKFAQPLATIEAELASKGDWEGELRHTTRYGAEVTVDGRWSLQRNEQREPTAILEINRDITDRKQAEQMRERLAAIVDSSDDAIISKTLEGIIVAWNRGAEKIFGYSAADILGKPMLTLLPADRVTEEATILARIGRGESVEHFETVRVRKDGTRIDVSVTISPIRDDTGKIIGASKVARDITQKKADELEIRKLNNELEQRISERTAQLKDANQELEAFSYSVSHDLRAPLRHIGGFSRILIEDFGSAMDVEARDHLQHIEDAVIRMGLLVDGLLSLATLGRQSLKLRLTALNAIVDQVLLVLQTECEGRRVEWRIAPLPVLECDPILIGQVLQNLLGNALKYTRGRAIATVEVDSLQEPGKPVVIFVRDNGAGFNMQYAEKLFGVFQRLHTEHEFEGTGVGLATVRRIVEKHGGSVWAEAELDRGATFFFTVGKKEGTQMAKTATLVT